MPKHLMDDTYQAVAAIPIYRAVIAGAGTTGIALPGGAGVRIIGITQDAVAGAATQPRNVVVRARGTTKAVASAAILRDALVSASGVTGTLKTAVAGENVVGTAVTAAGAVNDIFEVDLDRVNNIV